MTAAFNIVVLFDDLRATLLHLPSPGQQKSGSKAGSPPAAPCGRTTAREALARRSRPCSCKCPSQSSRARKSRSRLFCAPCAFSKTASALRHAVSCCIPCIACFLAFPVHPSYGDATPELSSAEFSIYAERIVSTVFISLLAWCFISEQPRLHDSIAPIEGCIVYELDTCVARGL